MSQLARRGRVLFLLLAAIVVADRAFAILQPMINDNVPFHLVRTFVAPAMIIVCFILLWQGDPVLRWLMSAWALLYGGSRLFIPCYGVYRVMAANSPEGFGIYWDTFMSLFQPTMFYGWFFVFVGFTLILARSLRCFFDHQAGKEEIAVPRWAAVAFCARAAELILPTIHRLWPDQPAKDRDLLSDTIRAAKESAARGQEAEGFSDLGFKTTQMGGRFVMHVNNIRRYDDCGFPDDDETCKTLGNAIIVAAKSHEAASDKDADQAHLWARDAYLWALDTVADDDALTETIKSSYRELHEAANANGWNHTTCVTWTDKGWRGKATRRPRWKLW